MRQGSRGAREQSSQVIERRLLSLAALFMLFLALALSLSPAARARTWEVDYRWSHWLGLLLWVGILLAAHWQLSRRLPERDPYLLPLAALLSGWGLLSVWRLAPAVGLRQSLWLSISIAIFIAGLRLPHDLGFLRRYKYVWLTGGLLLTALTLLLGTNPLGYGPRLWLGCCGLYLQPSEPLKLLLVVYLAAYLSGLSPHSLTLKRASLLPLLAPTLIMTGLAMALLLAQRDLGTASIFIFLYIMVVFVATGDARILVYGGLTLLLAGAAGYYLFDVVRLRVDAWLNPWLDPSGRSYQIVQSLLAVANGGLFGRGPGLGNPTLVPISHSDFIFAAIAEEHGLMGALAMLALIGMLALRSLRIALHAPDGYRRYLAAGLSAHLAGQSILIIGGNLRLLPLTGVTLPFVSYGGSSLFTSFLSLLLLVHISNREEEDPPAPPPTGSRAYLGLGAFSLLGLAAAGLTAGWWAFYRGPDLLTRTDNPRRAIADLSVKRGSILDRSNLPLAETLGEPGAYDRQIAYPDLSPVIGYSDPIYGQAGLEAALDPYLRGLRGNPGITIWWNHLLYGQPPAGLDARLSLDTALQGGADEALAEHAGALVLLDARNGEILAMASHPTFNANTLEGDWESLIKDPLTPLVNRATQRNYLLGELEGLLLPQGAETPGLALPGFYLPVAEPPRSDDPLQISPLQAALSAAGLTNAGKRPAPVLVQAVNTPSAGWVVLPAAGELVELYTPEEAQARTLALRQDDQLIWQKTAVVNGEVGRRLTWSIGGTLPSWSGMPLSIAVLLEEENPIQAAKIVQAVLKATMIP